MEEGGAPDHRLREAFQAYVAFLEVFLRSMCRVDAGGVASDPTRRTCVTTLFGRVRLALLGLFDTRTGRKDNAAYRSLRRTKACLASL